MLRYRCCWSKFEIYCKMGTINTEIPVVGHYVYKQEWNATYVWFWLFFPLFIVIKGFIYFVIFFNYCHFESVYDSLWHSKQLAFVCSLIATSAQGCSWNNIWATILNVRAKPVLPNSPWKLGLDGLQARLKLQFSCSSFVLSVCSYWLGARYRVTKVLLVLLFISGKLCGCCLNFENPPKCWKIRTILAPL